MIIGSSTIGMASSRTYSRVSSTAKTAESWGPSGYDCSTVNTTNVTDYSSKSQEDSLELTGEDREFSGIYSKLTSSGTQDTVTDLQRKNEANLRKIQQQAIDYLLKLIFGEDWEDYSRRINSTSNQLNTISQGYGGRTTLTHYEAEQETTCFQTTGTVITADGQEISFNLQLTMSRSFTSYTEQSIAYGADLVDPLVINLDGSAADVSDQTFYFDLDADGHKEAISKLSQGSGFLALDLNGDGIINDGSELFGTQSGDGFGDLAAYDEDGNGWIDQADGIFDRLMIYSVNDSGSHLVSIGAAGVGAIYLGHQNTEFSVNDLSTNATRAQVRSTGMFLYENGDLGTIQQVDLAK